MRGRGARWILCSCLLVFIRGPVVPGQTTLLPSQAQLTALGPSPSAFFGQPLAGGDLDGDGCDEVITAASNDGDGYRDRVFVFRGSPDFIASRVFSPETIDLATQSADLEILAAVEGDLTASSVAIGDVNGDTVGDLILAAPGATANGRALAGYVYVLFGGPSLFAAPTIDLSVAGSWDIRISGPEVGADTGGSGLAPFGGFDAQGLAVGNLNGDAYGDLVIGSHHAANFGGFGPNGRVFIIFGRAFAGGTTLDLAVAGASGYDVRITGPDDGDEIGDVVAVADLTGEGLDDLIIGDPFRTPTFSEFFEGEVQVLLGRTTGWPTTIDLASTNPDVRIRGTESDDELGSALTVGDFNADGIADVAIGAPGDLANPTGMNPISGLVHVYFGGTRFKAAGALYDIDANPADMVIIGFDGGSLGYWPCAAGDVNRDGVDDLLLAQRDAPINAVSQAGAVDVVLGRRGAAGPRTINLDGGEFDYRFAGVDPSDTVGTWAGAADTDGDGFSELLAGSSFRAGGLGAVWVVNLISATTTPVGAWRLYR